MLKRLIVILLISMFFISSVYAQDSEVDRDKTYSLNPYEIGTDKVIDAPDTIKVEYRNVWISSCEVKIVGKVTIPPKYEIVNLFIDYYVFDSTEEYTRVVPLTLVKGSIPNTFTFDISYPLDLNLYEYELFVIDFVNEESDMLNV